MTKNETSTYEAGLKQHKERRRGTMLRVAAEVFARNGLRKTTMDHVAERLGVSKIVLYRYFGSKSNLIHAILGRIVDLILEEDLKPVDWWGTRIHRNIALAHDNVDAFLLLLHHAAHDPEYGVYYTRFQKTLVERTEKRLNEIMDKPVRPPLDTTFCAQSICTFIFDAAMRWLETGDRKDDELFVAWMIDSIQAWGDKWRDYPVP